jgi:hypothetical protein
MPEIRIGEPYPWEPLPSGDEIIPGRESAGVTNLMERAVPFPVSPDPDIMREIESAADGGGSSGPRPPRTFDPDDFPESDPIDTLAFYRSFRYGDRWGVFILWHGMTTVGRTFAGAGLKPNLAYTAAQYLLKHHELFHFFVDRAVLTLETSAALRTSVKPALWHSFKSRHRDYELEEACANAYAYRMSRSNVRRAVRAFISSQPPGYREVDFDRRVPGTTWGSFQQSESQLLSDYLLGAGNEGTSRSVGLHSLLMYEDPKNGKNGNERLTLPDGQKLRVPMWLVH